MKTRLRLSVWLLLALAVLFLGCVILQELTRDKTGQITLPVYSSALVLASLALLACLTAACCFAKKWLSLRGIGFLICHLSLVLFLAAAFVWFVWGQSGTLTLSRIDKQGSSTLSSGDELPFTVTCDNFTVTYRVEDTFAYATPDGADYKERGKTALLAEVDGNGVRFLSDSLSCGKYGRVPLDAIYIDGVLQDQVVYNGILLTRLDESAAVRRYTASVTYSDGGHSALWVNHPDRHNGWKLYLKSYTDERVTLEAKRDPANAFAIAGLILCPVGTFLLCLRPRKKREEGAA